MDEKNDSSDIPIEKVLPREFLNELLEATKDERIRLKHNPMPIDLPIIVTHHPFYEQRCYDIRDYTALK